MKIALFGNVANNFYRLGKTLSDTPGYEPVLLLSENEESVNLPSHDDPSLEGRVPEWVKINEKFHLKEMFIHRRGPLLNELKQADVVILSSINVIASLFLRKQRVLFFATGGDLTVFPFWKRQARFIIEQRESNSLTTLVSLVRALPLSLLMKAAIRSCDYIVVNPFLPFSLAVRKLKIPERNQMDVYLPVAIDIDKFYLKEKSDLELDEQSLALFEQFEYKILAPSRLLTNDHPDYIESGQYKQNDLMLEVMVSILKIYPTLSVGLFFIDRGKGDRGETLKMKNRIEDLQLSDKVVWLKPKNGSAFNRAELIDFYCMSNLIVDEFGVGWFGSVSLEALSCSRPVLCYVDEAVMKELYPWHPFISSLDVEEIAQKVHDLLINPKKAQELGEKGRLWIESFHSSKAVSQRCLQISNLIFTATP